MTKRTKTKSARGAVNLAVGKLPTVSPAPVLSLPTVPRAARTEAQKRDAVALLESRGDRSVLAIAAEVGCAPSQLYEWQRKYGTTESAYKSGETLESEVRRLRRANALLTKERDFLKKVHAFFVKDGL